MPAPPLPRRYRLRRALRRYFRRVDILDGLANLTIVGIAVNSLSVLPTLSLSLGAVYLFFTGWRVLLVTRRRRARDMTERMAICQLFQWFYDQMFGTAPDRRFTLFVVDALDPKHIIPKVRFSRGHPVCEAELESSARYTRGEGFTGRAWEKLEELMFEELPEFATREDFTNYYVNTLKIPRETVDRLSDYMVRVRAIYSYGFKDHEGNLSGVVSIDIKGPPERLDPTEIEEMLGALGGVLEAFSYERRP